MPYRQGITQRCETAPRRAVHHEAVHGHAGLTDTEHSMRSTEHGMHAEHGMRALGSSALGLVPVSAGGDHASGRLAYVHAACKPRADPGVAACAADALKWSQSCDRGSGPDGCESRDKESRDQESRSAVRGARTSSTTAAPGHPRCMHGTRIMADRLQVTIPSLARMPTWGQRGWGQG